MTEWEKQKIKYICDDCDCNDICATSLIISTESCDYLLSRLNDYKQEISKTLDEIKNSVVYANFMGSNSHFDLCQKMEDIKKSRGIG